MLVSVQSYSEGSSYEQRGSHEIPLAESDPECYLLRLCNASMWGAITVSYKIRLAVNNGADLQQEEAELLAALEGSECIVKYIDSSFFTYKQLACIYA